MPILFRDVRPEGVEGPLSDISVVFRDANDRIWISWPSPDDNSGGIETPIDPIELVEKLKKFEADLQQYCYKADCGCAHHDNVVHLKAHQDSWFTIFGWKLPLALDVDPVSATLIPDAPMVEPITKMVPELERLKVDVQVFNRSVVELFIKKRLSIPSTSLFPQGTLFLGFKRCYAQLSEMGRQWQLLEEKEQPTIFDYSDATGSATFQQIVERLGIHVFRTVGDIARDETRHVSGASFEVIVARARKNSSLPAYKDGTPRRQWRVGSLLAIKRPTFTSSSGTSTKYMSNPALVNPTDQAARVSRALINELQILSHGPLRDHKNIVHLFGISWDHDSAGSTYNSSPILIQPCADHGNLQLYLVEKKEADTLSWSNRCDILHQILTGLQVLHECRIIHGDIKCLNILVQSGKDSDKPTVMLSDFGFSIVTSPSQEEVQVAGATMRFASPEIYSCKDFKLPVDDAFASDIYSFGLTSCSVIFGGNDPFNEIIEIWNTNLDSDSSDVLSVVGDSPDIGGTTSSREIWSYTKTNPKAGEHMILSFVIGILTEATKYQAEDGYNVGLWLCQTLLWSPKDRVADIPQLLQQFEAVTESSPRPSLSNEGPSQSK